MPGTSEPNLRFGLWRAASEITARARRIYNVFAIQDGRIARIDDYADRESALRAAALE